LYIQITKNKKLIPTTNRYSESLEDFGGFFFCSLLD
jgi:hypothetical protein